MIKLDDINIGDRIWFLTTQSTQTRRGKVLAVHHAIAAQEECIQVMDDTEYLGHFRVVPTRLCFASLQESRIHYRELKKNGKKIT